MAYGTTNGGAPVGNSGVPAKGGTMGAGAKVIAEKTKSVGYESGDSPMVMSFGRTDSSTALQDVEPKRIDITNTGTVPLYTIVKYNEYGADATDTGAIWIHSILLAGESFSPPIRSVGRTNAGGIELEPIEGTSIDWTAPDSNAYVASSTSLLAEAQAADEPEITIDDGSAGSVQNMFKVGDLIRIEDEIMRVTAITDTDGDAAYTPMSITVEKGLYGSSSTSHNNNDPIRFPFFNMHGEFDSTNKLSTDVQGKWWSKNFFGLGRKALAVPAGITPGTFCMRFYSQGYQELGLSGITSSTNSGLVAGGSYWLKIAIDGGTAESINFTLDSSNVAFGGTNGVISKIQSVLDEKYYNKDANIFEQKATVGIIDGDIRFTSGSHLSTSAIALTAGADGASAAYNWFAQLNGRIKALANIDAAVPARLPDDSVFDPITYNASPNKTEFAYDLGDGTITGAATGTINYETGELKLLNAPPLANFEYSVAHTGALSGKLNSDDASRINSIMVIHANSLSRKMSSEINIKVY